MAKWNEHDDGHLSLNVQNLLKFEVHELEEPVEIQREQKDADGKVIQEQLMGTHQARRQQFRPLRKDWGRWGVLGNYPSQEDACSACV